MHRESTNAPQQIPVRWTDEEEAVAARLMVELGNTGTMTANQLNLAFHGNRPVRTKNSVICRLHRRGLSRDWSQVARPTVRCRSRRGGNVEAAEKPKAPAVRLTVNPAILAIQNARAEARNARSEGRPATAAELNERRRVEALAKGAISLFESGHKRCKWPVQGIGMHMLVCGDAVPDGMQAPYCPACYALAYVPAKSRPSAPRESTVVRVAPSSDRTEELGFGAAA